MPKPPQSRHNPYARTYTTRVRGKKPVNILVRDLIEGQDAKGNQAHIIQCFDHAISLLRVFMREYRICVCFYNDGDHVLTVFDQGELTNLDDEIWLDYSMGKDNVLHLDDVHDSWPEQQEQICALEAAIASAYTSSGLYCAGDTNANGVEFDPATKTFTFN